MAGILALVAINVFIGLVLSPSHVSEFLGESGWVDSPWFATKTTPSPDPSSGSDSDTDPSNVQSSGGITINPFGSGGSNPSDDPGVQDSSAQGVFGFGAQSLENFTFLSSIIAADVGGVHTNIDLISPAPNRTLAIYEHPVNFGSVHYIKETTDGGVTWNDFENTPIGFDVLGDSVGRVHSSWQYLNDTLIYFVDLAANANLGFGSYNGTGWSYRHILNTTQNEGARPHIAAPTPDDLLVFYLFTNTSSGIFDARTARSSDAGQTWEFLGSFDEVLVASLANADLIAYNATTLFVAYTDSSSDLIFGRSDNAGDSWVLTTLEQEVGYSPRLQLLSDQQVYFTYVNGSSGLSSVIFANSSDGGATWEKEVIDTPGGPLHADFHIENSSHFYIAYQDSDSKLAVSYSEDGGSSWTTGSTGEEMGASGDNQRITVATSGDELVMSGLDEFLNVRFVTSDTTLLFPPQIGQVQLNSSLGQNDTSENLTAYVLGVEDPNNDTVKPIYNWFVDNSSIAVLNMPFEGGSNSTFTKDYSGFGNDGSVTGATYNSTGGSDGFGAYAFNSATNQFIILPHDDVSAQGVGTIEFTFKLDSDTNGIVAIFNLNNNASSTQTRIDFAADQRTVTSSQDLFVQVRTDDTSQWSIVVPESTFNSKTNLAWHHVAIVQDGSAPVLYIDGVPVGSLSGSAQGAWFDDVFAASSPATTMALGTSWLNGAEEATTSAAWEHFHGKMGQFNIYNRALSQEQVAALFNNRTDLIVSQETAAGDTWQVCATPNDGTEDGVEVCSNELTVLPNPISACATLSPGRYQLTQNVSAAGSCMLLSSPGIELDCAGHTIFWGTGNTNTVYGIEVSGNNSVIRNCTVQSNATGAVTNNYGIYAHGTSEIVVDNIVVGTKGTSTNHMMFLDDMQGATITNISLIGGSTSNSNFGLYLSSTTDAVVDGAYIQIQPTGGTGANDIVRIDGTTSNNITMRNSVLNRTLSGTHGVRISAADNLVFDNITISATATNAFSTESDADNITISRSTITSTSTGVLMSGGSDALTLRDSTVSAAGNIARAVWLQGENNVIINNNISTDGANSMYGIYVLATSGSGNLDASNTQIINNTISTNGTGGSQYGIHLLTVANGRTINNTVIRGNTIRTDNTHGSLANNYGIFADVVAEGAANRFITHTTIEDNVILTGGLKDNVGIVLDRADNSTVRNNVINTSGTSVLEGFNHGVWIVTDADDNTLLNNTINPTGVESFGVLIEASRNATLADNTINAQWDGVFINGDALDEFSSHSIAPNNSINGRNVSYYGGSGASPACPVGTLSSPDTAHLALIACNDVTIDNIVPEDSLLLVGSQRVTVTNSGVFGNKHGIRLWLGAHNNTISDNSFNTSGFSEDHGIYVRYASSDNNITGNTVNTRGSGLGSFTTTNNHGVYLLTDIYRTTLEDNTIHASGSLANHGLVLEDNVSQTVAVNNSFTGNGSGSQDWASNGALLTGASNGTFRSNTFIGVRGSGIEMGANSHYNLFEYNTLSAADTTPNNAFNHNTGSGGSTDTIIRHNTLDNSQVGSTAFNLIGGSTNIQVFNNTILIGGNDGIFLQGTNLHVNVNISSNTIAGTGGQAMDIDDGLNMTIQNNFINVTGTGIFFGTSRPIGARVLDNEIYFLGSNNRGLQFNGAVTNALVMNNLITNPAAGEVGTYIGIDVDGLGNNITNNQVMVYGASATGFFLSGTTVRNNSISNNNITLNPGSTAWGIQFFNNGDENTFDNNRIIINGTGATYFGIDFNSGATDNTFTNTYIQLNASGSRGIYNRVTGDQTFTNTIINDTPRWVGGQTSGFLNLTNTTFVTPHGTVQVEGNIYFNESSGFFDVDRTRFDITANNVYLNSSAVPSFNKSAQLTLNNIAEFDTIEVDYEDDGTFIECPPQDCQIISYNDSVLTFNVSHFTTFRTATDSAILEIFDSGDAQGGGNILFETGLVEFFANYTNATTGEPIGNTSGSCNISIPVLVNNTAMTFNESGTNLYVYSTAFGQSGTFNWSVDCTNTLGLGNLSASDNVTVLEAIGPVPEFSEYALMVVLLLTISGFVLLRRKE